jgi:cell division protein FtsB
MRWIIAVFALALVAMQVELWLGDDRMPALRDLRAEVALQSAENQALAERNADLAAEIRNLEEGTEAAEERARSDLGLLRADETFYQIAEVDRTLTAP